MIMGVKNKMIFKDNIDYCIDNLDKIIDMNNNSDTYIYDKWSDSFYQNLRLDWKNYQKERNFKQKSNLKYLSNIYFNLMNNPKQIDVNLLINTLQVNIDKKQNFKQKINTCLEKIDKYFLYG